MILNVGGEVRLGEMSVLLEISNLIKEKSLVEAWQFSFL